MADIFNTEDSVFFVGGTGTKAGHATPGGCTKAWYDANFTALTDIMGSDGAPLISETGCSPSVGFTLIKANAFADAEVGMVAHLSGINVPSPGFYKILSVVPPHEIRFPNGTFNGTTADVVCNIGGAFSSLQLALDETDAANYKVEIFTNKNETLSATLDADTGGATTLNKWLIGIDDNGTELTQGNYVTLDGDSTAANCVKVVDIVIGFRNIRFTGATSSGLLIDNTSARYGYFIKNCKFDANVYGLNLFDTNSRASQVVDCVFLNNTTRNVRSNGLSGAHFLDCIFEASTSISQAYISGDATFHFCIFIGGSTGVNCVTAGLVKVANCTFFNQTSQCIYMSNSNSRLIEYNNIFMPAAAADFAVKVNIGEVIYSDYSCAYAYNGGSPVALTQAWPVGFKGDNSIEVDPLFVDAAGADFTPQIPDVIYGGKSDVNGNVTEMGAILKMSRPTVGFGGGL